MKQANAVSDHENEAKGNIVGAAVRLFARRGYDATSVREIAGAAGVTKPTIYYYFGSKEGLGLAVVAQAQQKMEAYLERGIAGSGDVVERLVAFVEGHFAMCKEDRATALFLYGLSFSPEESKLKLDVLSFRAGANQMLNSLLDAAIEERVVSEEMREEAALMLMGMINIRMMAFLKLGLELNRDVAVRTVRLFLDGVGTDHHRTDSGAD